MKTVVTWLLGAIAVASLVGNLVLYKRYSTTHPIVTIGSDVITKKTFNNALEFQAGDQVLRKLVYTLLIRRAASAQHLMPSNADIDARLAEIQRTNPQLLANANNNPVQMAEVKDDLRTDLALENLRTVSVKVTPAQIQAFYDAHKQQFSLPQQVQTTMVVTRNSTDAGTAEMLLQQGISEDAIARQPRMYVAGVNGFNVNINALAPSDRSKISKTIFGLRPGQMTTIPVTGGVFLTFKVKQNAHNGIPPLSAISDKVTRAAKLSLAPSPPKEIALLYQAAKPQFDSTAYSNQFNDVANFNTQSAK